MGVFIYACPPVGLNPQPIPTIPKEFYPPFIPADPCVQGETSSTEKLLEENKALKEQVLKLLQLVEKLTDIISAQQKVIRA